MCPNGDLGHCDTFCFPDFDAVNGLKLKGNMTYKQMDPDAWVKTDNW